MGRPTWPSTSCCREDLIPSPPLADIAAAGGWKGTEALQRCYLHADEETMLAVVMSGAQLSEVRKA